jgi:hypothetical protein
MADYITDDMSEAFDYCREKGHPVTVCVCGVRFKLYPSGRTVNLPCRSELERRKAKPAPTASGQIPPAEVSRVLGAFFRGVRL